MTYCYRCVVCKARLESPERGQTGPLHCGEYSKRDYQAESALIDKFSLRQDVRGTRAHRADVMPPDEANKVNQERKS